MAENILARFLNFSNTILNRVCRKNELDWFISFGALLYFIRDKNMGNKFQTDMDVSVLGQVPVDEVMSYFAQYNFKLVGKVIDNITRMPFQMTFRYSDEGYKYDLDIFFWVKANGYWWHTYDYYSQGKKIPKEYIFKGTNKRAFGEVIKMKWEDIAPPVNFPSTYGTLLDIWYPDWLTPRKGQSQCDKMVKLKTCKKLKDKLC